MRKQLDAFLKEWGDKGQVSLDHIRFLTYTTRYNRCYWVSLDGLEKHYERPEIDARRGRRGTMSSIDRHSLRSTDSNASGRAITVPTPASKMTRTLPSPNSPATMSSSLAIPAVIVGSRD